MKMTPRQKAAQEALEAAIREHMSAYAEDLEGQQYVAEWALIANIVDGRDDDLAVYHLAFSNGDIADHRAVGLFEWAIFRLKMLAFRDST